ncbi:hypothetical protein SAMN02745116_02089 [Pilibacter termitis]|uniref:Uncharacterized protein n=1 Tax=Pilibacter termitis TaxID=263852 RepID=A0A1T4Q7A2_9ENTE|nr:hypothetical protein [Pilibacter termitis]SJZ99564.1 hypothetical protein SAMN02745116_02089 [Pilibacter termitis]
MKRRTFLFIGCIMLAIPIFLLRFRPVLPRNIVSIQTNVESIEKKIEIRREFLNGTEMIYSAPKIETVESQVRKSSNIGESHIFLTIGEQELELVPYVNENVSLFDIEIIVKEVNQKLKVKTSYRDKVTNQVKNVTIE